MLPLNNIVKCKPNNSAKKEGNRNLHEDRQISYVP